MNRPALRRHAAANDNPPPAADERRARPRRRVLMQGQLAYVNDGFGGDCAIRNLSDGGALVASDPGAALPRDPFLVVVRDGVVRQTRTVWRHGGLIGLAFVEPRPDRAPPRRLAHLQRR